MRREDEVAPISPPACSLPPPSRALTHRLGQRDDSPPASPAADLPALLAWEDEGGGPSPAAMPAGQLAYWPEAAASFDDAGGAVARGQAPPPPLEVTLRSCDMSPWVPPAWEAPSPPPFALLPPASPFDLPLPAELAFDVPPISPCCHGDPALRLSPLALEDPVELFGGLPPLAVDDLCLGASPKRLDPGTETFMPMTPPWRSPERRTRDARGQAMSSMPPPHTAATGGPGVGRLRHGVGSSAGLHLGGDGLGAPPRRRERGPSEVMADAPPAKRARRAPRPYSP